MGFLFLICALPYLYLCYWTKQLEIETRKELERKIEESNARMKRRKNND